MPVPRQDARWFVQHQLHDVCAWPSGRLRRLAEGGATGWSYNDVLPYFRRAKDSCQATRPLSIRRCITATAISGVSIRSPALPAANDFVEAAVAAGIPRGDYNGRDRGGAETGAVSLTQYTTRRGRRSSTYHAFLEGGVEQRRNLTIITGAQATRLIVEGAPGPLTATGVGIARRRATQAVHATKEVILSAGAMGSPHLLLLSGIGPRAELEAVGVPCLLDQPHVGKHLRRITWTCRCFPRRGRFYQRGHTVDGSLCPAPPRRTIASRPRRRRDTVRTRCRS